MAIRKEAKRKDSKYNTAYKRKYLRDHTSYRKRQLANTNRWKEKNPEAAYKSKMDHYYRKKYGITFDQYEEMLKSQNYGCKLCGRKQIKNRLAVDHDHNDGRVRGILCSSCNLALGQLEPHIDRVIQYLLSRLEGTP